VQQGQAISPRGTSLDLLEQHRVRQLLLHVWVLLLHLMLLVVRQGLLLQLMYWIERILKIMLVKHGRLLLLLPRATRWPQWAEMCTETIMLLLLLQAGTLW
jgi:hypothetical protein